MSEHQIPVDTVTEHIDNNKFKVKRIVRLHQQIDHMLTWLYCEHVLSGNPLSYSQIIERAIDAYHMMYLQAQIEITPLLTEGEEHGPKE